MFAAPSKRSANNLESVIEIHNLAEANYDPRVYYI
jgi:hypothetical protein